MTNPEFRSIRPDEAGELREMAIRIHWDCFPGIVSEEEIRDRLESLYDRGNLAGILASPFPSEGWEWFMVDGRPCGYLRWDCGQDIAQLREVFLERAFHGRGLGQRMLQRFEIHAVASGTRWMQLQVHARNLRAIRAYRRAGYRWTASRQLGFSPAMELMRQRTPRPHTRLQRLWDTPMP